MRPEKAQKAIDAAIDLFGQYGIDNTSTQAIAKHAGIGNGTLFKYFETKNELIREAYCNVKLEAVARIKQGLQPTDTFEHMMRVIWRNYLQWSLEHPHSYNFSQQIKSSRFVDSEIEDKIQHEYLFFTMALNAAKTAGKIIDEPLELIQATILMFFDMAVAFAKADVNISEQQVYQLMLNSLKIKSETD